MQITVKLFATFQIDRFKIQDREYPDGTSVEAVVLDLGLQDKKLGTALVNSLIVNLDQVLIDGDVLALFPMVAGG